jgi:hypothetical protein
MFFPGNGRPSEQHSERRPAFLIRLLLRRRVRACLLRCTRSNSSTYCQVRLRIPPVACLAFMPVCTGALRNLVRNTGWRLREILPGCDRGSAAALAALREMPSSAPFEYHLVETGFPADPSAHFVRSRPRQSMARVSPGAADQAPCRFSACKGAHHRLFFFTCRRRFCRISGTLIGNISKERLKSAACSRF